MHRTSRRPRKPEASAAAAPAAAPPEPEVPAQPDPTRSVRTTLKGLGAVVAPTSAVSGLLYYFGWARTMAQANRMGLDDSLLGYSSQDYLLRSMSSMYTPLLCGLMSLLVAVALHALIVGWASRLGLRADTGVVDARGRGPMRRLVAAVALLGLALLVAGYLGSTVRQPSRALYVGGPVAVTVGVLLLVYAAALARRFLTGRGPEGTPGTLAGFDGVVVGALVMLVMVSLFWDVGRYAVVKGNQLADTVEATVSSRPGVILYSEKRLYLQAPVVETKLDPEDAAYKYAYTGLKLLFRSDGRYFLRPSDTGASRTNIVIPDGLDIRLELFHG